MERVGGKRKKREGEKNMSRRATVQAPAKTARVEERGEGREGGGERPW